jgi:hypothetical protein
MYELEVFVSATLQMKSQINFVKTWEDNIKIDLQKVGGGCGEWMELAQDRDRWQALVSMVMNLHVPKMWGIS